MATILYSNWSKLNHKFPLFWFALFVIRKGNFNLKLLDKNVNDITWYRFVLGYILPHYNDENILQILLGCKLDF